MWTSRGTAALDRLHMYFERRYLFVLLCCGCGVCCAYAAVRRGDLEQFGRVLDQCGAQFQKERTYTLIIRLRHNVIKTGIRMISLSYSR